MRSMSRVACRTFVNPTEAQQKRLQSLIAIREGRFICGDAVDQ